MLREAFSIKKGWPQNIGLAQPTHITHHTPPPQPKKLQVNPQMKFIFRVLPVVFLPITAQMPAGCLLYWGSSNLFSIGQSLLLKNPAVKRHFGIPDIPKVSPMGG